MANSLLNDFAFDEAGATAIEYALIAGLIAVVIVGAVGLVGDELVTSYDAIGAALEEVNGTS